MPFCVLIFLRLFFFLCFLSITPVCELFPFQFAGLSLGFYPLYSILDLLHNAVIGFIWMQVNDHWGCFSFCSLKVPCSNWFLGGHRLWKQHWHTDNMFTVYICPFTLCWSNSNIHSTLLVADGNIWHFRCSAAVVCKPKTIGWKTLI